MLPVSEIAAVIFEISSIPPFTISDPNIGLPAGTYNYTIQDSVGCAFVLTNVTVNQPTALNVEVDSITAATGPLKADGMVDVSVGGGTGYEYFWINAQGDTIATTQDLVQTLPGVLLIVCARRKWLYVWSGFPLS